VSQLFVEVIILGKTKVL